MNWRKEKNILIFESGKQIVFNYPIKHVEDSVYCPDGMEVDLDVPIDLRAEANNFIVLKKEQEIKFGEHLHYPEQERTSGKQELARFCTCVLDWGKEDNVLTIGTSQRVAFEYPICAILETEGIIIVVLDIPPKISMTENVFGVSAEGKVFWQIERISETSKDPVNCYVDLSADTLPGICFAANWNGICATVDIKTGKILDTDFVK